MSDAAFKTARYPGLTTSQLLAAIEAEHENAPLMRAEVERRAKVAAGDRSVMTPGERLRQGEIERAHYGNVR